MKKSKQCFLMCHSPTIPACIKPQTSVSMKRIQSLSQTAVKTKESAAFSDNLDVFRIRRCVHWCASALFTGAGISMLKSICRRALSSHRAAVIVSSIYSNYSFHHFWFTKKKECFVKGFLIVSQSFLLIFRWENTDVYSCSQFTDDHNPTEWKQGSDCF